MWKKTLVVRIQEDGRRQWRNGFAINEREQQYVYMKSQPKNEKYANGSVGARVRLMVRGGCLPVRGSKGMDWKYDDDLCACGTKDPGVSLPAGGIAAYIQYSVGYFFPLSKHRKRRYFQEVLIYLLISTRERTSKVFCTCTTV